MRDGMDWRVTSQTPLFQKKKSLTTTITFGNIEKAFRIAKTDLKIRPIYHQLRRRIEAHICIAFVAYKVYKELERQLKLLQSKLSPEKAIEIAKTIYSIKAIKPISNEAIYQTLILNEEQKHLTELFEL